MAGDAPLLERLAGMTPVAASEVLELIERLRETQSDPVIGPLFGVDDEGEAVANTLMPTVLQQFQDKPELTCYAALVEGLTRVWTAEVRAPVVTHRRAAGLPQSELSR